MKRSGLAVLVAVALAGCAPNGLYIASETVVGVNGKINTEKKSGNVQIGYDREFVTIVPRSVNEASAPLPGTGLNDKDQAKEAMAVLGCSKVVVDGIFLTKFKESLATGRAAQKYATKLGSGDSADTGLFSCFH